METVAEQGARPASCQGETLHKRVGKHMESMNCPTELPVITDRNYYVENGGDDRDEAPHQARQNPQEVACRQLAAAQTLEYTTHTPTIWPAGTAAAAAATTTAMTPLRRSHLFEEQRNRIVRLQNKKVVWRKATDWETQSRARRGKTRNS